MHHPAMQQPRPASAAAIAGRDAAHYPRDARNELQRKEQELSQLRMAALHTLEQQVSGVTLLVPLLQLLLDCRLDCNCCWEGM